MQEFNKWEKSLAQKKEHNTSEDKEETILLPVFTELHLSPPAYLLSPFFFPLLPKSTTPIAYTS